MSMLKRKDFLRYCCFDLQRFIGLGYLTVEDTGGRRGLLREWNCDKRLMCVYLRYCPFCGKQLDIPDKDD